jgi:hypothetical protein
MGAIMAIARRFSRYVRGRGRAAVVARLVTYADLDEAGTSDRRLSVSARLDAELADGRSLVLLDDRGWTSSSGRDVRAHISPEEVERTARMVVGPDEPPEGTTAEQTASAHWSALASTLARQGVQVDAADLRRLPHAVRLGARLRDWLLPSP